MSQVKWEEYLGSVVLPGETEPRKVSVALDTEGKAVKFQFEEPVEGGLVWEGEAVQVAHRLKYDEVVCLTSGLPKESVELTWKFNAGLLDNTAAGVVIARPNNLRISGEKGFILSRSSGKA